MEQREPITNTDNSSSNTWYNTRFLYTLGEAGGGSHTVNHFSWRPTDQNVENADYTSYSVESHIW